MRLFVAIELSAEVVGAAARLVDELRRQCQRLAPRARVSWVPPERLHLTLRFIGDVDEARAPAIERALDSPVDARPFEIVIAGVGAFPGAGPPRVIWAGVTTGHDAVTSLCREVSARLAASGVPVDPRPFSAHLTLGRVREPAGLRTRSVFEEFADAALGRSLVTETVLFESRHGGHGPDYVARVRTPLRSS